MTKTFWISYGLLWLYLILAQVLPRIIIWIGGRR